MEATTTELEMLTMKDVMRILQVSRPTAYRLLLKWNIKIFREGQLIRIFRHEFERAIQNNLHQY